VELLSLFRGHICQQAQVVLFNGYLTAARAKLAFRTMFVEYQRRCSTARLLRPHLREGGLYDFRQLRQRYGDRAKLRAMNQLSAARQPAGDVMYGESVEC